MDSIPFISQKKSMEPVMKLSLEPLPVSSSMIRPRHTRELRAWDYLHSLAQKYDGITAKKCISGPNMILIDHFLQLGNKETPYYGTEIHALIDDIAKAYQDAILDFYDHGCRYLQIDDTSWTYLIDENFQKKITALGYTKGQILNWFQLVSTKALEHKPEDFFIATHFCKGNFKGNPLFHGFYDSVAPVIAEIPYDAFFVEYDDARSGSFAPWSVLKDKDAIFVAGLISTKNPLLEDHDFLKKTLCRSPLRSRRADRTFSAMWLCFR